MLKNEIPYDQLQLKYNIESIIDLSTNSSHIFPGNSEAIQKLISIIELNDNINHIYISSNKGTNTEDFLIELLENKINYNNVYDWCYVHNFDDSYKPNVLKLEKGDGTKFKDKINLCIDKIIDDCRKYFSSKEYKIAEKAVKEEYIAKGERKLNKLKEEAKKLGFSTHVTEKGIFFIPIINGKKISEKEYDNLDADKQEQIISDLDKIENKSKSVMKDVKYLRKIANEKVEAMYNHSISSILDNNFEQLEERYLKNNKVLDYVNNLKKDLLNTIEGILSDVITSEDTADILCKYRINLLVDTNENIPVIYSRNPSYYDLFGKIEYENELGTYSTDHMLIEPGLIHKANGGLLILDVKNLLSDRLIWENLKSTILKKEAKIENLREYYGGLPIRTIKPESIPINTKIILIGEENIFRILWEYDNDFRQIFSYHICIEDEMEIKEENIAQLFSYLDNFCNKNKIKKTSISGKEELLKYGVHYVGNKTKATTKTDEYDKLLIVANNYANKSEALTINNNHINNARIEINQLNSYYNKKIDKLYKDRILLIQTWGKKVAQINGISIQDYGNYKTGCPIRITAVTYVGENRVINAEKENDLSGKIFGKGITILNGYLGKLLSEEESMNINSSISFEQVYGQIDGDSALCAGLYAILSSLSKIPIRQDIAITGSIDQLGNIQPVGGVSKKIEGFYSACKAQGITGSQGVIIPSKNIDDLVLNDEVLNQIKNNNFHIYYIDKVEDGLPIVMGKDFGYIKKRIIKNIDKIKKEKKTITFRRKKHMH